MQDPLGLSTWRPEPALPLLHGDIEGEKGSRGTKTGSSLSFSWIPSPRYRCILPTHSFPCQRPEPAHSRLRDKRLVQGQGCGSQRVQPQWDITVPPGSAALRPFAHGVVQTEVSIVSASSCSRRPGWDPGWMCGHLFARCDPSIPAGSGRAPAPPTRGRALGRAANFALSWALASPAREHSHAATHPPPCNASVIKSHRPDSQAGCGGRKKGWGKAPGRDKNNLGRERRGPSSGAGARTACGCSGRGSARAPLGAHRGARRRRLGSGVAGEFPAGLVRERRAALGGPSPPSLAASQPSQGAAPEARRSRSAPRHQGAPHPLPAPIAAPARAPPRRLRGPPGTESGRRERRDRAGERARAPTGGLAGLLQTRP